jgi:hypothetical protein
MGCSNVISSSQMGTVTAQAGQVVALATRMGQYAQATRLAGNEQAQATARAIEIQQQEAENWSIQFNDPFDEDLEKWFIGEEEDPALASVRWSIESGGYWWRGRAIDGFVWWVTPDAEAVTDFYLSVKARQLNGPETGEYGIIFRQQDENHYYLFEVIDRGEYAVYLYTPDGWLALIEWTPHPSIKPGMIKKLAVLGLGDRFDLFINDEYLDSFTDSQLLSGQAGLLVGLSNAGDEGTWIFDDFELRVPE